MKAHSLLLASKQQHDARVRERDAFVRSTAREIRLSLPVARSSLAGGLEDDRVVPVEGGGSLGGGVGGVSGVSSGSVPLSDSAISRFEGAMKAHVEGAHNALMDCKAAHR
jgi:hypothetical protein